MVWSKTMERQNHKSMIRFPFLVYYSNSHFITIINLSYAFMCFAFQTSASMFLVLCFGFQFPVFSHFAQVFNHLHCYSFQSFQYCYFTIDVPQETLLFPIQFPFLNRQCTRKKTFDCISIQIRPFFVLLYTLLSCFCFALPRFCYP